MNKAIRYGVAAIALCLLAACGKVGPLEPKTGQAPPDKLYGQTETPDSNALMTASEQSRPGRSDELMRRSERRSHDPFDLPPGKNDKDAATKGEKPAAKPADPATQPE
jgi:predicted small lipoprotein YifL